VPEVNEFEFTFRYLPVIAAGTVTTLQLSSVAIIIGIILGTILGLMRSSHIRPVRVLAAAYIEVFRSIPILLLLYFVYFAMPLLLRIDIPSFPAAVTGLGLYCSGYMAEVVRTGVEAVAKGQWEAGYSLGMPYRGVLRWVVLPQAISVAIPPAISVCIVVVKDSALASVIGYVELTNAGVAVREAAFGRASIGVLVVVAAIYFAINYSLSLAGQYFERKVRT
jgi:polar amino acid transport system permease protein